LRVGSLAGKVLVGARVAVGATVAVELGKDVAVRAFVAVGWGTVVWVGSVVATWVGAVVAVTTAKGCVAVEAVIKLVVAVGMAVRSRLTCVAMSEEDTVGVALLNEHEVNNIAKKMKIDNERFMVPPQKIIKLLCNSSGPCENTSNSETFTPRLSSHVINFYD